jgi:hypothetical protein
MYTPPDDLADEPAHVAKYLSGAIVVAWQAFDRGRVAADDFFAAEDRREFNPHLWAHIARYEAVLSLKAESEPHEWDLRLAHHSSIEIRQDGFRVRVGKAAGDGPQNPGRNLERKRFFQQFGLLGPLFASDRMNLILYWRVVRGELDLGLCKPKGLWSFKGQPKLEWRQPVRYDPYAGLSFPTADEQETLTFDLAAEGFGDEEVGS